jgi:hypothetical protein
MYIIKFTKFTLMFIQCALKDMKSIKTFFILLKLFNLTFININYLQEIIKLLIKYDYISFKFDNNMDYIIYILYYLMI